MVPSIMKKSENHNWDIQNLTDRGAVEETERKTRAVTFEIKFGSKMGNLLKLPRISGHNKTSIQWTPASNLSQQQQKIFW